MEKISLRLFPTIISNIFSMYQHNRHAFSQFPQRFFFHVGFHEISTENLRSALLSSDRAKRSTLNRKKAYKHIENDFHNRKKLSHVSHELYKRKLSTEFFRISEVSKLFVAFPFHRKKDLRDVEISRISL